MLLCGRNKADLDTMSLMISTTNSRCMKPVVNGMSSSCSATEHGFFNDAYSTNIDNMSDAVICAFFASQLNSSQLVHEDLQQIHPDDMERFEMANGHVDYKGKKVFEEYNNEAYC
ncbi:hypothetical protein Tco_1276131 [Tanacetum coccineum]